MNTAFRAVVALALFLPAAAFADVNGAPTLSSGQTLNLDTGAIANSGGDIQFTGGKIALVGSATGWDIILHGGSAEFSSTASQGFLCATSSIFGPAPITVSVNDIVGIHTNAGDYAKLLVTAVSGSSITIQFITYTSGCTSGGGTGGSTGGSGGGTPGGPTIRANGVVNAASFADPRLPDGSIAQGSIFNVFGSGLGPNDIVGVTSLPLQKSMAGTTVSVTVNGTTVQCLMIYTLAGQIAAILPSNTPVGTGTVIVSYNGTPSATAPITVVKSSFGIFTVNQQGTGTGVILDGNYDPSSSSFAFQPGETVAAWGTGLGPISGSDADTPPSGPLPGVDVVVSVGGVNANLVYHGRTGYAGEDQINFTIPQGVTGCNVPVAISTTSGGVTIMSNTVTIAVDPTLTCTTPQNSAAGLEAALGKSSVRVGNVLLNHSVVTVPTLSGSGSVTAVKSTSDTAVAEFATFSANSFAFTGFDIPYGACIIVNTPKTGTVTRTGLDAGSTINISGPGGTRQLTQPTGVTGSFFNIIGGAASKPSLPLYFSPGTYSVNNGSGGNDVGEFNINIAVPADFVWTNYDSITTVPESQPFNVTWTGGDPAWDVYLEGSSGATADALVNFQCRAHDSDGHLTVPVSILQALPPSGSTLGIPVGGLTMVTAPTSIQTVTVSGLDLFYPVYTVEYQNSNITFTK